jgi:hypothetical protein
VLRSVGADDFDLDESGVAALRDVAPSVARNCKRIDRVGDNVASKAKIVDCDRVSGHVTFWAAEWESRVAQSLLDRVDSQVDGPAITSQASRKRRLPCPWQAGKDVENGHAC